MKKKLIMLLACTMVMGAVPVMASDVDTTEGFSTEVSFTVDENGEVTDYAVGDEKLGVDYTTGNVALNTSSWTDIAGNFNPGLWDTIFITSLASNPGNASIQVVHSDGSGVHTSSQSIAPTQTIKTNRIYGEVDIQGKASSTPGNYRFKLESNA